jgi:hypothetical protein
LTNISDAIALVMSGSGVTKKLATEFLKALAIVVQEQLKMGMCVRLPSIGSLKPSSSGKTFFVPSKHISTNLSDEDLIAAEERAGALNNYATWVTARAAAKKKAGETFTLKGANEGYVTVNNKKTVKRE